MRIIEAPGPGGARPARVGQRLTASATAVHLGRTTQVWDATVTVDDARVIAVFRCTQLVLADRPGQPG